MGLSLEPESATINVPPTCVVADPASTYIRQLETKVRLLEGDKPLAQVGWLGATAGGSAHCALRVSVSPAPDPQSRAQLCPGLPGAPFPLTSVAAHPPHRHLRHLLELWGHGPDPHSVAFGVSPSGL